jgi:hypothetical protein
LALKEKFKSKVDKLDSAVYNAHLQVPSAIAKKYLKAEAKRVICDINGTISFPAAIMPNGQNYYFILLNKPMLKKMKLNFGDEVNVTITPDTSKYGMPLSEELKEVLSQDIEFENHFERLTPGKQRNLIYYISKFKSSDLKISKALTIADHLKANNGKLDFKLLNEALKKS